MSNIENIFADRRKKEQELKLTYSKYIFNSHLIMFLIIVLGAALINYSKWIAVASQFELYSVFMAASLAFSYYLISTKIKTYIKEADAVFLLPLEKYYKNVGRKTVINVSVTHIIAFVIFYFAVKPITNIIGSIDKLSICLLLMVIIINNLLKYVQVIHYKEIIWIKILQFIVTFIQIIAVFITNTYIHIADIAGIIGLAFCAYYVIKNSTGSKSSEDQEKLVVKWNEAAEYDKHRMESYLKFVNMFVDVPLSGVKVARRKYFDGKSLSEIETVQIHLAKIYSQTNAAVLGTNEAARSFLNKDADMLAKILSARIFASEAAIELARLGMRVGGGKAYNRVGNMERYLRDAFASHIMAPSVDVLTIWLGKAITGQQLP